MTCQRCTECEDAVFDEDDGEDEGSMFREDINQIREAAGLPVLPKT